MLMQSFALFAVKYTRIVGRDRDMESHMKPIDHWMNDPSARAAAASFGDGSAIVETAIAIQQIPAPTFDEARRSAEVAERMRALGLADVRIDTVGNVYGRRPGHTGGPRLLIAAHLDTVFPAGTDLAIRYEGARIYGPGLGDNSMGVAALLHLAYALGQADVANAGDIWFVGNVGEEGLGDLRGMRAAVDTLGDRIGAAIALEGCEPGRIIHAGRRCGSWGSTNSSGSMMCGAARSSTSRSASASPTSRKS